MIRFLHWLVFKLLYHLYGDDITPFLSGELASRIEAEVYGDGEILERIEIIPDEEIGYHVCTYSDYPSAVNNA